MEAVRARDLAALEGLIDDGFTYVHSTGRVDDRASYLDYVQSGPAFVALDFSGSAARVTGEMATFADELRLTLRRTLAEEPVVLNVHSLQAWRRVAGRWRLSAARTTRRA